MRLNGQLSCLKSNWLRPEDFILRSVPLRDKEPSDELNLTVLEKEAIERALRRAEGNITRAAELLGLPALPCIVNWRNLAYDTLLVVRSYFWGSWSCLLLPHS